MTKDFYAVDDFYPTPELLLDKIFDGFKFDRVGSVLEPSAGKGDICDYIAKKTNPRGYNHIEADIDAIEVDETLANVLRAKNYRLVGSDFLNFSSHKKYGLIAMNPPFSEGCKHLLHAIELQKDGGAIICILNAETIKNPYSNERKLLLIELERLNANVEFMKSEFSNAERKTDVEIAVIKIDIPRKELESEFLSRLRKKYYAESDTVNAAETSLAENDIVNAVLREYAIEAEAGIKLIEEYQAFSKKCGLLKMTFEGSGNDLSVNGFIRKLNYKYWSNLFSNPKFTGKMTSKQRSNWQTQLNILKDYEFSRFNIIQIFKKMNEELIGGIEETIIALFDELSFQHSYYDTSKNIHYFTGWKTNSAYMVNRKVIIPCMDAFSTYWKDEFDPYKVKGKLEDIERALNYLDGGITEGVSVDEALQKAKEEGKYKGVRFKFFTCDFYKKGTTHLRFLPEAEELWKKFNIFGAQHKGWLPQEYGRKAYKDMTSEEKEVIDSFEGEKEYAKVCEKVDYFVYNPAESGLPMLPMSA